MNLLKGVAFLLFQILSIKTADIVSEEKNADNKQDNDHIQQHSERTDRRFIDDLDDKDWHVSHLKDADFNYRTDCKEETFSDKANKYRKTLKEDGSKVDYVLADALPVNDEDLNKDRCIPASKTVKGTAPSKIEKILNGTDDIDKNSAVITDEVNSATRPGIVKQKSIDQNVTKEKSRRTNEYEFSSAEYYDEVDDFRDNFCPEFVEVVHLEIDILRNYDIESEVSEEYKEERSNTKHAQSSTQYQGIGKLQEVYFNDRAQSTTNMYFFLNSKDMAE